jgi:hypothetical protein
VGLDPICCGGGNSGEIICGFFLVADHILAVLDTSLSSWGSIRINCSETSVELY